MEQQIDNFFTWSWKCHWFDGLSHCHVQNVYLHTFRMQCICRWWCDVL